MSATGPKSPQSVGLPRRPLLTPGTLVTRRADGHLQVGLDPGRAVVLADLPATRRLLADLSAGRALAEDPAVRPLLTRLSSRGLLADGDALRHDLPRSATGAHSVAAVYAEAGLAAPAVLARRATRSVGVDLPAALTGALGDLVDPRRLVDDLLGHAGVPVLPGPAPEAASAVLLVSLGELDRARVDDLVRADRPHLVLSFLERTARLGPFVVPGRSACLRCVDAARGEADPRRSLVVEQYARSPVARPDGVPAPLDPAVAVVALGWAARELVTHVDGLTPDTASLTVEIGPGMRQRRTAWARHPQCGCAWDELADAG